MRWCCHATLFISLPLSLSLYIITCVYYIYIYICWIDNILYIGGLTKNLMVDQQLALLSTNYTQYLFFLGVGKSLHVHVLNLHLCWQHFPMIYIYIYTSYLIVCPIISLLKLLKAYFNFHLSVGKPWSSRLVVYTFSIHGDICVTLITLIVFVSHYIHTYS